MSLEEGKRHLQMAQERLDAARMLAEREFLRDAASRAYYAMYHAAYALVRTKGHAPSTHRGLAHLLFEDFVEDGSLPRERLSDFRQGQEIREMGDYELLFRIGNDGIEDLIEDAEIFLRAAAERIEEE